MPKRPSPSSAVFARKLRWLGLLSAALLAPRTSPADSAASPVIYRDGLYYLPHRWRSTPYLVALGFVPLRFQPRPSPRPVAVAPPSAPVPSAPPETTAPSAKPVGEKPASAAAMVASTAPVAPSPSSPHPAPSPAPAAPSSASPSAPAAEPSAESHLVAAAESQPPAPAAEPPVALLSDDTPRPVRPQELLPFFQLPAGKPGAPGTQPSPTVVVSPPDSGNNTIVPPPSSATYQQQ